MDTTSDLPQGWYVATLDKLSENRDKRRVPLSSRERQKRQGPYPYWGANGVLDHVDAYLFEGPHVLIAEDGTVERADRRAVVHWVDGQFWVNNHAHVLTASSGINQKWLYYALRNVYIPPYLTGSVQLKLTQANLRRISLITPPKDEQDQIVTVLSSLDAKIDINRRLANTLEDTASALFRAWFSEFIGHSDLQQSELGPIPRGWAIGHIGELCEQVRNGGTPKRMEPEYWEGGTINWFKTGELTGGFLPRHSALRITERGLAESSCALFPRGTVLIAIYAAPTVGRLGILDSEGACNQACTALVPKDLVGFPFLYLALEALRGYFNMHASGSAQQNISKKMVESAPVVVPPNEVLGQFDHIVRPLFERAAMALREAETLEAIRDALLPRLISGQVRVAAEDGPSLEVA